MRLAGLLLLLFAACQADITLPPASLQDAGGADVGSQDAESSD